MNSLMYCRCCLIMDVKLHSFDSKMFGEELRDMYKQILQLQVTASWQVPKKLTAFPHWIPMLFLCAKYVPAFWSPEASNCIYLSLKFDNQNVIFLDTYKSGYICFECSAVLYRCKIFKDKCLKAHQILTSYIKSETRISKAVIENVDRKKNKLQTNYTCSGVININNITNQEEEDEVVIKKEVDEESGVKIETSSNSKVFVNINDSTHFSSDEGDVSEAKKKNVKACTTQHKLTKQISKKQKQKNSKHEGLMTKTSKVKRKNLRKEKVKAESASSDEFYDSDVFSEPDNMSTDFNSSDENDLMKLHIEKKKDLSDNKILKTLSDIKKEGLSEINKTKSKDKLSGKKISVKSKKKPTNILDFLKNHVVIVFLTQDEAQKEILLRKESRNYINSPFKCEYCFKGYGLKSTFENHIRKHEEDSGPHKCEICHVRYKKQYALNGHFKATHKMKFICKQCPFFSYGLGQAKRHVNFHKGKKYTCKECGASFSMPTTLASHLRHKHETQVVCEFCGETFFAESGVRMHKRKLHWKEKNEKQGPKCDECDVHFANETAWKRHLVLSSKHEVQNGCKECGETYQDANELRIHIKNSHEQIKYVKPQYPRLCSICDQVLTTHDEYRNHIENDHPGCGNTWITNRTFIEKRSTVCEVCGQTFKSLHLLRYHQRRHTGERPYKCPECGKSFYMMANLKIHRVRHKNLPLFKCDMCGKSFTMKSYLSKHIKNSHWNIRPHKCLHCDMAFNSQYQVRVHVQHVHYKVPWPKRDRSKRK